MPHWFAPLLNGGSTSAHNSGTNSEASSAPPSRPGSPTLRAASSRNVSGARAPPNLTLPGTRTPAYQDSDPLSDIYGSRPSTPGYSAEAFPGTPTTTASAASSFHPPSRSQSMATSISSSGADRYSHVNHHLPPLEIHLDSDLVVLRGAGGDVNPALLTGQVILNLTESTNIKELTLKLEGKAKVAFFDASGASGSKNHHFTHHFLTHDWSFLQGAKNHSHTIKAGRHAFPFGFTFEGNLPATLKTYLNDANISYKLRATAVRSAFSSNFHAQKNVTVVKSFTNEALEYNQTLEIENTWPGKVMYCLTLPFKAYAAGDEIPVNVKFMPLAKGVKVTSVSSVVKEYTQVHTRHSSHNEVRVAASTKHEIKNGRAYRVTEAGAAPMAPPAHHYYSDDAVPPGSAAPSAPSSPHQRAVRDHTLGNPPPLTDSGLSSRISSFANLAGSSIGRAHDGYFGHPGSGSGSANATPGPSHPTIADIPDDMRNADDDDINIGDDEVDTMITIPIPSWTTPSHNVHPVYVTHKIKWSCAISNPDGHVSELRCALPIHILPHAVLEEAQTASAGTRALLFGGQSEETTQVDLPSYNDHVYDRVANAALGPTTSYVASGNRTPHSGTPPASRGPSRPGSPVLRPRRGPDNVEGDESHMSEDVPERPQLNWADSELLLSLGGLAAANNSDVRSSHSSPHATPPESRTPSRPGSRLGFRSGRTSGSGSRAGSRASSPERPPSVATIQGGSMANGMASVVPPPMERKPSHGIPSLFHLPSGIKPLTSLAGRGALKSQSQSGSNSVEHSPAGSPTLGPSSGGRLPRASFSLGSHSAFTALEDRSRLHHGAELHQSGTATAPAVSEPVVDALSQVPSYAVAREWLGGGVVPTSALPPTYDDSERMLDRARSEGDLVALGQHAEEANSLAARLHQLSTSSEHHSGEDGPGPDGSRATPLSSAAH